MRNNGKSCTVKKVKKQQQRHQANGYFKAIAHLLAHKANLCVVVVHLDFIEIKYK